MPSAQCSGSKGDCVGGSFCPGKNSASSTAAEPKPASAQRARNWGSTWLSTTYTVTTNQAVTDSACAKPKRAPPCPPKSAQPSAAACNAQATTSAQRARLSPSARQASAGTA